MKFVKAIKTILTLRCDHAARLLSGQCDHPLTQSEKIALRLHVSFCRSCRRYEKQLRFFRHLFSDLRERLFTDQSLPKASKNLREKIIKALRKTDEK